MLHLLLEGTFHLSRPDGPILALSAGDLVGIHAGANDTGEGDPGMSLHCVTAPDREGEAAGGDVVSIRYPRGHAGDLESLSVPLPAVHHLRADEVRRDRGLAAIVGLLRAELSRDPGDQLSLAQSLTTPLLAFVERCWRQTRLFDARLPAPEPRDGRLARVVATMRGRPEHAWTVASLARAAGLSRAAFARRFLAEIGIPPLRFLAEVRMEVASRLLAEGEESLAGIAAQVGYESEFAFSRAFKRHRGEAPGGFRRRVRAERGPIARAA